MARAAIPEYLDNTDLSDCPPGHRFTLYGAFWEREWSAVRAREPDLHRNFGSLADSAVTLMRAVRARQDAIARQLGESVAVFSARSMAPFATGTGIEHPLENGMAFLNPYGLAYLPGSSVKGVLRRAAEELAGRAPGVDWGSEAGWNRDAIDALFGLETAPGNEAASRGGLVFWDVIPECEGLRVEIMNPHYGDYYRGNSTPHDAGTPIPIYFLTVPEESRFCFHVQCQPRRTRAISNWRELLEEAFRHAFDWLGFGAKTAVGYGAMQRLSEEQIAEQRKQQEAEALRCPWVDETIERLVMEHKSNPDEVLRGKALANAWKNLEDESLKSRALADIRARWQEQEWWDSPPSKAARKIRAIYEEQQ